ncbi:hypothetical protein CHISP_2667 [Chitinispirillum alkaliphilum]|nr:hypothetical protein CHISP_2667 [Chitinispirillum alkaliphilum]
MLFDHTESTGKEGYNFELLLRQLNLHKNFSIYHRANGSKLLKKNYRVQIRPNHWRMSAFAGPFIGPIVRVLEFWPFPGGSANIGASVGLPRRSLPTFFGLGKKQVGVWG